MHIETVEIGPWRRAGRRFIRQPAGVTGAVLVSLACVAALFAPLIAPHDPLFAFAGYELEAPSARFLAGTDPLGRDILSRMIYGLRVSILVGLVATLVGAVFGATSGMIAGFVGGRFDSITMRIWDLVISVPAVILTIALVAVLGAGPATIAIGVGIWSTPVFARVARSASLSATQSGYVLAARSIGVHESRIFYRHIVPNCLSPLLVQAALFVGAAILLESGLSFLGLGSQPPTPSLGSMLADASRYLRSAWWYGIFPGLLLTLLVMGLNATADAMRDALDPKTTR